jgi:mannan endo-1,4-beta-mannosidase
MAKTFKDALGNSTDILVTTGGGGWVDTSLLDGYFSCPAIDVLAIHAYGPADMTASKLAPYVGKAAAARKMLLMQEWGACYHDTINNSCQVSGVLPETTRAANLRAWASAFGDAGVPWMYWQVIPNDDPHTAWDYEM